MPTSLPLSYLGFLEAARQKSTTAIAPPMSIGYHDFMRLYQDSRISMYHYGTGYGATLNMLLMERQSGIGHLKRVVSAISPMPNAAGMLHEFLTRTFQPAPIDGRRSTGFTYLEEQVLWNLSDADYLYFQLATSPDMQDATPITISLKGAPKLVGDIAVIYEADIFDPILEKARAVPLPFITTGLERTLG